MMFSRSRYAKFCQREEAAVAREVQKADGGEQQCGDGELQIHGRPDSSPPYTSPPRRFVRSPDPSIASSNAARSRGRHAIACLEPACDGTKTAVTSSHDASRQSGVTPTAASRPGEGASMSRACRCESAWPIQLAARHDSPAPVSSRQYDGMNWPLLRSGQRRSDIFSSASAPADEGREGEE